MADLRKENIRPTIGTAAAVALPTVADQAGDPVVVATATIVEVAPANADRLYIEVFAIVALNVGIGAAPGVGLTWAEIPAGGSWYSEGAGLWGGKVFVYQATGGNIDVPVIEY